MNDKQFFQEEEENYIDVEEDTPIGLCSRCLGSGYAIRNKDGAFGVLFTAQSQDNEGRWIKRLVPCDCNVTVSY